MYRGPASLLKLGLPDQVASNPNKLQELSVSPLSAGKQINYSLFPNSWQGKNYVTNSRSVVILFSELVEFIVFLFEVIQFHLGWVLAGCPDSVSLNDLFKPCNLVGFFGKLLL